MATSSPALSRLFTARAALLVWVPIGVVALIHYGTDPHMHWVHDVARRLFYLPIIAAGILGGLRGGLLVASLTVLVYLPHALLLDHAHDPGSGTEKVLEMLFYVVIGGVSGAMTERLQQTLEVVRERDRQLARAQRLQSLGELTAGLAHEIKNPLHAMRGTAEILLDAVPSDSKEREVGQGIIGEIDRLDTVLRRFLDFARKSEPEVEVVSLREVATQVHDLVRAQAGGQETVIEVLDSEDASVLADRDQLVQVVLGICINALQSLQMGGVVHLSVCSGDGLSGLCIDNDGPPIPDDLIDRLFDPFVSTRDGGTGLGLATAWRIVDAHGGRIEVENVDEGVAFTVWLPSAAED